MDLLGKESCTGILLAGGKSTRMGLDKGLIIWKGKYLVEYPLLLMEQFCKTIIISTGNPEYEKFGYRLIPDQQKDIGPMGGLYAGLVASDTEHNLVLSCDMPLIDTGIIESIFRLAAHYQAVMPVANGHRIPVCAYYHKSVIDVIFSHIARELFKMQLMLDHLKIGKIHINDEQTKQKLINVNTLADLDNLLPASHQ